MISSAIGKVVDKLPPWPKFIFYGIGLAATAYGIARYGFWSTALHAIFSP